MKTYQEQQNKWFIWLKRGLILAVGLVFFLGTFYAFRLYQANDSSVDEIVENKQPGQIVPGGYIHFLAPEAESSRSYPSAFSFADDDFVEVSQDNDTYYIDIARSFGVSDPVYLQAPYKERAANDYYYPYEYDPLLVAGDDKVELPIINPQNTRWSEVASAYALTGLGSEYVANTPEREVFYPDNYANPENWSIYLVRRDEEGLAEPEEVVPGVQPTWLPEEKIFYYLNNPGIYAYNAQTGKATLLTQMYGRLPTSNSSLEISKDGTRLYVLSSVAALEHDAILVYEIAENDPYNLALLNTIDLPDDGGTYTDLTISPYGHFAGFVEYNESDLTMYFKIINLKKKPAVPETIFSWDKLNQKYYPHAEPRWVNGLEVIN